jgi:adenylyltransferase/sulfurtransferase
MTVIELHERATRGDRPLLLDVRTPEEWEICRLDGARLIPLQTLPAHTAELDKEAEVVVYCHTGNRSAIAVAFLRRAGFARAENLVGGVAAWAAEIDPAMPRY